MYRAINILRQRKDKLSLFNKNYIVFVCFCLFTMVTKANNGSLGLRTIDTYSLHQNINAISLTSEDSLTVKKVKFKRGKAILLTIFTGFLGGHRIYLGTHHRTPIIYSITFGGVGIIPFIDLIHIIFTKDLSKFEHKTQIIMWGKD
ncbi:MAG: TM2 domain-containing protein [Vicingaceae bacterium]